MHVRLRFEVGMLLCPVDKSLSSDFILLTDFLIEKPNLSIRPNLPSMRIQFTLPRHSGASKTMVYKSGRSPSMSVLEPI